MPERPSVAFQGRRDGRSAFSLINAKWSAALERAGYAVEDYREEAAPPGLPPGWWYYRFYGDGAEIRREERRLYRRREDLRRAFPKPFSSGPDTYQQWFAAEHRG